MGQFRRGELGAALTSMHKASIDVDIYAQGQYRSCKFSSCQMLSTIKCPRQWVTPTCSCSATWHSFQFFLNCHISTGHNKGQQSAAIQFRPPSAGNKNIREKLMYTHTLVIIIALICFYSMTFFQGNKKTIYIQIPKQQLTWQMAKIIISIF